ncbi:MAG: pyridoxamine 5'-phosphate oxidase [Betaproteobacteria bacterium HGW-Betaproteobacteria-8]|nr:MAG: pyridoxamine 5'-phosphate oxidase [Betaproteobacteria bacterium HGW-Betaproteobacteria-8]
MSLANEARLFLRSTRSGILSTNSVKFAGYPFGSVAPFMLDHDGQPLLLISTIAEHTKNIIADCKVSLLVFVGAEDLQANARLTLLGEAEQTDKNDELLKTRYLRYFPAAEQYFAMHDFYFYRLQIQHARYIAGFGNMGWMDGSAFRSPRTPLIAQEADIIEHMNTDHQENLKNYCRHFHGICPDNARMVGIDTDGFDLRADQQILRFNFEQPIHDAVDARAALVEMAKVSRT